MNIKDKILEYYDEYGPIEIKCTGADLLPVDVIKDFQGKLKTRTDANLLRLIKNIFMNGWIAPFFLWDDNGVMKTLDGHSRDLAVIAIRDAGVPIPDAFPVDYIHAADEAEARKFLLSLTSQYGEFEQSVLDTWVSELEDEIAETLRIVDTEVELAIASITNTETTGDDDVPDEVPPITVLGDLWELGSGKNVHRLLCGDSTDIETVKRLLNNTKPCMAYNDPPYGIGIKGDNSKRGKETSLMKGGLNLKDFVDDSIEYAVKSFKICEELKILRQVWWGANYYAHHIPQSNNWFVWDKRVEDKMKNTNSDCELAWVRSKWSSVRIFRHLWNGLIKASEKGERRVHPTQKPVALAVWSFDYFRDVKSVLDLFGGSGSTLIACEQTERQCFMMELSEHYASVIIFRWINWMTANNKEITIRRNGEPVDITTLKCETKEK